MLNKKDFSILKNNPTLTYLDSAATSLTPDVVIEAMNDYYYNYRATVNRSLYKNGQKADRAYIEARNDIAKFIKADFDEIIFVKSTTSGMNLIARNIVKMLNPGDEILTSELEHHSTLLPFREFGLENDISTTYIEVDNHQITYENFLKKVSNDTKVVVLHHVSNVIGDRVDIKSISKYCRIHNIITIFDGAQAVAHERIDVKEIDCDFYVFSGHKILGPTGIGVIYARKEIAKNFIFEYGGDMAHLVTKEELTVKDLPHRLEAGTPSIAEIIGLGAAVRYLEQIDFNELHNYIYNLKLYLIEQLKDIPEVEIYNANFENGLVTFNVKNLPAHDAISNLSMDDIAIRGGHMCNQLTLRYLGVNSVLRASIYIYNDLADIDKFIKSLKLAIKDPLRWDLELFS